MPAFRRRLPHIHPEGAYLFITWRLWGTIPKCAESFLAADREVDAASNGQKWLADPRIGAIVVEAIRDGESIHSFYELRAWALMPNHVHLLILPRAPVPRLMQWLKGSTARRANEILGRTGQPFWQIESYDHWVRDRWELEKIVTYIEDNPGAAGLVNWPWSSGVSQAKACATEGGSQAEACATEGGSQAKACATE